MSENSIRDEIADEIAGVVTGEGYYSMTIGVDAARESADLILASPVFRRIQAAAIRDARDELGVYIGDEDGEYWDGYRQGQRRQFAVLSGYADRIEGEGP